MQRKSSLPSHGSVLFEVAMLIFVLAFIGLAVAGVFSATSGSWSWDGGVGVWTDPKTGCRYTRSEFGMQPLVGRDGQPDCGGAQ